MLRLECTGCHTIHEVEERRIPSAGLKMRCTKCGTSLLVRHPDAASRQSSDSVTDDAALPMVRSAPPQNGLPAVLGEVEGLPMPSKGGVRTAPTAQPPPRPSSLGAPALRGRSAPTEPSPGIVPAGAGAVTATSMGTTGAATPTGTATRRPPPVAPRPRGEVGSELRAGGPKGESPGRPKPDPAPSATLRDSEPDLGEWDLPSAWTPPPPPPNRGPSAAAPDRGPATVPPERAASAAHLRPPAPATARTQPLESRRARPADSDDLPAVLRGIDLPVAAPTDAGRDLPEVLAALPRPVPAAVAPSSVSGPRPAVSSASSSVSGLRPAVSSAPAPAGPQFATADDELPAILASPRHPPAASVAGGVLAPLALDVEAPDLPIRASSARQADLPTLAKPDGATPGGSNLDEDTFGELDLPLLAAEPPVLSAPLPVLSSSDVLPSVAAELPTLSNPGVDLSTEGPPDRDWLSLPPEAGPAPDEQVTTPFGGAELTLDPIASHPRGGGLDAKSRPASERDEFGNLDLPEGEQIIPIVLDDPARASGPAFSARANAGGHASAAISSSQSARGAGARASLSGGAGSQAASADAELTDLTDEVSFSSAPPPNPAAASSSDIAIDDDMEFGAIPQGDGQPPALDAVPPSSTARVATAPDSKPRSAPQHNHRRLVLPGVAAVLVLLGASLEVVGPYGAFGRHYLSDLAHADGYRALQASTIDGARRLLANDVYADASRAIALTEEAHSKAPRVGALLAYGAYLGYMNQLRFGRNPSTEAHARQQLARVAENRSFHAELAQVAETAVGSRIPRARQLLETLARTQPRDPDVILLSAELALLAKEPSKALEEFRKAEEVLGPSGRTAFGIARACWAAGDEPHALEAARTAVQRSRSHAAARVLLARVLWDRGDEAEALSVLQEVTTPGAIRDAASQVELVDGLTLTSRIHMARSRMSQAEAVLAEALRIDGKSAAALAGMGEVLYREGRFTDALAKFDAGILADPEGMQAKIGSAKAKIALERLQEAKEQLKKLRDARQNDPEVSLWLGRAEEALGDKAAAEKSYQEAILVGGTKPEVVDAYMGLAQLLVRDGRTTEADSVLSEARRKLPASPALHLGLADVHFQAGRYDAAKTEFDAAVRQDPQDLAARFRLAITLRHMGKFDAASEEFDRIAARDPQYPGLALERGLLYEATNRTREALEYYQQALAKAPDDPDLLLRVGSAEVASGHASQAEDILRKVVAKRPNSADVNHYLGRALLLKESNLAEGLRFLQRAVELDPNRAEYHLYVGWAANEAGQPALARQELDRALELDKGLADAYWQKGELLRKQSAIVDAMRFAEKALELRPSRFEAYATMAQCYQDQNRTAEAIGAWRKAIAANNNVAEWHYRLGKLLGRAGEPELSKAVQLSELVDAKPGWLAQAYFELAESEQASGRRSDAIQHFRRFLAIAKPDSPYRPDAKKALTTLGAPYDD